MTSIFSEHLKKNQFTQDDIRDLELDFQYNHEQYSKTKKVEKDHNYYVEQTNKFKSEFKEIWDTILFIHESSGNNDLLSNHKYLFYQFIDLLYPKSPKKDRFLEYIKKPLSRKNLLSEFDKAGKKEPSKVSAPINTSPITFLGQQGGASFFFVDDILQLNPEGIDWCKKDQENCTGEQDKFENFSNMLFRFVEYKNDDCLVKLIHPHDLYEAWGGEDSDDLLFPEKYLKKKIN
tara:strand:+ start:3576 stop:4274 length:699 start_codon:yes stop_codon:yes gene_type:complete